MYSDHFIQEMVMFSEHFLVDLDLTNAVESNDAVLIEQLIMKYDTSNMLMHCDNIVVGFNAALYKAITSGKWELILPFIRYLEKARSLNTSLRRPIYYEDYYNRPSYDEERGFVKGAPDNEYAMGGPLLKAILLRNVELVKKLIDFGIPINPPDGGISRYLLVARDQSSREIVQLLSQNGANDIIDFRYYPRFGSCKSFYRSLAG